MQSWLGCSRRKSKQWLTSKKLAKQEGVKEKGKKRSEVFKNIESEDNDD